MYTISDESVRHAVGAAASEIPLTMKEGRQYRLTSTTDCYVRVTSAAGTAASLGNGSTLLLAGQVLLVGQLGAADQAGVAKNRISIIRNTADGFATLTEIVKLPSK